MAIFKANFVKRGKDAPKRAKASVRSIRHRRGVPIQWVGSACVFDIKGDLYKQTAGYRKTLLATWVDDPLEEIDGGEEDTIA